MAPAIEIDSVTSLSAQPKRPDLIPYVAGRESYKVDRDAYVLAKNGKKANYQGMSMFMAIAAVSTDLAPAFSAGWVCLA